MPTCEAAPWALLQALLQAGMSELLATAADGTIPESWPRVHAFNCLRLAFNDRNLSSDTSGYFSQGARQSSSLPVGCNNANMSHCRAQHRLHV